MKMFCLLVSFGLVCSACEGERDLQVDDEKRRNLATMQTDGLIVSAESESQSMYKLELTSSVDSMCSTVDPSQTIIDLNTSSSSFDGEIIVRKNVWSDDHRIMATAYTNGDEAVVDRYVWNMQETTFASFSSLAWDNNTVEIHVRKDLFDNHGSEPTSLATVCAINSFDQTLGCRLFTLIGVIDLEGEWIVSGTGSTSLAVVQLTQTGRSVRLEPSFGNALTGDLFENVLSFEEGSLLYICIFTSRTHCEGIVTDTHKGKVVGEWIADRLTSLAGSN